MKKRTTTHAPQQNPSPSSRVVYDARAAIPNFSPDEYNVPGGGRDRSGHGLIQGRLGRENVVVKPHSNLRKAELELQGIRVVASSGLVTPPPIGLYHGNNFYYLVSQKYPGLSTLGQQNLSLSVADPGTAAIGRRLTNAAQNLSRLHLQGASHGDYQAKNVAEGSAGEGVFIDLENLRQDTGLRGAVDRTNDLAILGSSVLRAGFLADRSPRYRVDYMKETIAIPHQEVARRGLGGDSLIDYGLALEVIEGTATTGRTRTVRQYLGRTGGS